MSLRQASASRAGEDLNHYTRPALKGMNLSLKLRDFHKDLTRYQKYSFIVIIIIIIIIIIIRGQTPICGVLHSCCFLPFPAKISGFLRKSAVPTCFVFQDNFEPSQYSGTANTQARERHLIGACAMTTRFLGNRTCTFKILLSWRFPRL